MRFNLKPSTSSPAKPASEEQKPAPDSKPKPGSVMDLIKAKREAKVTQATMKAPEEKPVEEKTNSIIVAKPAPKPATTIQITSGPENTGVDSFTDEQMNTAREAFAAFRDAFENNGEIAYALRETMIALREAPQFSDTLEPEDIGMMVAALRMSYGQTLERKGTKRAKKAEKVSDVNDFAQIMQDIGGITI